MTQSIVDYRISKEHQLRIRLSKLLRLKKQGKLKMQHNNEDFAIAKDTGYWTDCMTQASYQFVGDPKGESFIVFVTDCDARFGIYNGDREATLPVDLHELLHTWTDESVKFQRNMIAILLRDLDSIIEQSA